MELGSLLGPYRIDRELGSGGMGRVYAATVEGRCRGLEPGTRVALKVVHPHLLEAPGFFKRFLREADLGKTVRHPNVVRTFECDATGGQHFIAMEYVEGQTLRELLDELDPVPEELCRHIAREVCKGLSAIHRAGALHRDVKPDNVLITPEHVVKLMDLGVARLQDEALRLSQTGAFVGSIHYAAPECFQDGGKDTDARADLHALGLVLYELSCGVNPYVADDVPQILKKVLHEAPRRLGEVNPQLSPCFEEVVHCLLEKVPKERFASADELLGVLEAGEDSDWWHARSRSIQATTRRPIRRIRIPRETAVYGRENELAKLSALYEAAKSGDGQVVLIEGEAGIGKSRLVDELVGRLQQGGEDLNFLFGSYPPGGGATTEGGLSSAYRDQFGAAGSADHLSENQLLVPAFDALLRGEGAPEGAQALTAGSLSTCFVRATQSLAAERTTVVLIDDLHFAPEEGRALFSSLAAAMPGHRVLLIGSTRPGIPDEWRAGLTRSEHTTELPVHRLGPKDLVALLADSLGSTRLAEELSGKIAVKSDGNPFFAFEIIRGLREGQFITQGDDGSWVSTRVIDDLEIPSSVLNLVNARVSDLTEDQRNLLDVAACWGYEFDPAIVGDALGLPRIPTLRALGQIERQHRLVRSQGRTYVFDHHQVQEALYGALNEYLREEYHAALAAALETRTSASGRAPETLGGAVCVDLCEHHLKGAQGRSALRYLEVAQAHLTSGYLHAHVVDLTDRALAFDGLLTGAERAKSLLCLADALESMGDRSRVTECAREAERLAEEAGEEELRAAAAHSLGWSLYQVSRYEEAEEALRRAIAIARARGSREDEAASTGSLGSVLRAQGRLLQAREHFERRLALCLEIGDRQGEANALCGLGLMQSSAGRFGEALDHLQRYLALSRELGNRRGEAIATGNLGLVLEKQGQLMAAREHYTQCAAISREVGFRAGEASAVGNLGGILLAQGRLRAAQEHLERSLTLDRESGNRRGEAAMLVNLSRVRYECGESALARQSAQECLGLSREIGHREVEATALRMLGQLAAEDGDGTNALRLLEQSVLLFRDHRLDVGLTGALIELGDLHRRAGAIGPARTALDEALSSGRRLGRAMDVALAAALLACLPQSDAAEAVAALADAGEMGDSPRLRWSLYLATDEQAYLVQAKNLLDERLAHAAPGCRDPMLTNLRVNGEILSAWEGCCGSNSSD